MLNTFQPRNACSVPAPHKLNLDLQGLSESAVCHPRRDVEFYWTNCYLLPIQGSCYQQLETLPSPSLTMEARLEIFVSFLVSRRVFLQQMSKSGEEIKNNSENMEIKLISVALDKQKCITETYHIQTCILLMTLTW